MRRIGNRRTLIALGSAVLLAGGLIAVEASRTTSPPPPASTRYVALGDSVPYGHGLNNPYVTAQIGLPKSAVSQGPSLQAWPSLVQKSLKLSMNVRPTNCTLTGDQLSISGAQASAKDASKSPAPSTAINYQCPGIRNVQTTEIPADNLATKPAALVTIQAGADDIDFGGCIEGALSHGVLQSECVSPDNAPTPSVQRDLSNVTSALTAEIETVSSHTKRVAVVNYYDPIPSPTDFAKSSIEESGHRVNPLCLLIGMNKNSVSTQGEAIVHALNTAIHQAVLNAQAAGNKNVTYVDISKVEDGHEMCTADPAIFSGEPMPISEFTSDLFTIALSGSQNDIRRHLWRAAHPNQLGQQDIAKAVEATLLSSARVSVQRPSSS
jgi:GDSL-like Lipase/Acylhydrolase